MAPVDIGGLRSACSTPVGAESGVLLAGVVAVMLAPLADAIFIEPERRCSTRRQRCAIPGAPASRMAGAGDRGHPEAHRLPRRASTLPQPGAPLPRRFVGTQEEATVRQWKTIVVGV